MANNYTKNLAKRITENSLIDSENGILFVTNPGISFEALKGLAKRHNFTIGQTNSGEYVSIPTSYKYLKDDSDLFTLYDDFTSTYTFYDTNRSTLLSAYKTFDAMEENFGEIALILDTYVAEVLGLGFVENPLKISISNENAQELVQKILYKNKIYDKLPGIVKAIAKYGNYGVILSYPYLEQWLENIDENEFKRIDVLEDLILTFVNPKYFSVHTDEYYNVINYETEIEKRYVNITSQTHNNSTKIWQPWQFCFTGDTKISLLDGRELTLKEIEKEFGDGEFWVYSCNEKGRILPGRAHSLKKTRENAELVEVELDNGEKIHCTPDHKFMLRDGTYCEASKLSSGISLMPLYRQKINSSHNRRGYEQFFDNHAQKWMYTHWRVAEEIYGTKRDANGRFSKSYHVHHKDFNSLNNSPNNLQWLTCAEHNKLHNDIIKDPILDANRRKSSSEALKRTWAENYEEMCKKSSENQIKICTKRLAETGSKVTDAQREASRRNGQKVGLSRKGCKTSIEHQQKCRLGNKKYFERLREELTEAQYKLVMKLRKNGTKLKDLDLTLINHKVVAVRPYHCEDVYDFTVDKYHNFALSAGVFVHNCHFKIYDEVTEPYGKSMLWSMRSAFDQLTTLEALLGISRASKLQRLVFTVPLPNGINMVDAGGFLNEFRSNYLNSIFTDNNAPKAGRKLPGAMSILTLPESYDGKKVSVDKIEAQINLSENDDVQYFLDKILRNSNLPKGYLVGEDVITTAQALEAQDLKLRRALIPLKKAFLNGMMNLVENILTHCGYDVSKLEVEVALNEPIQIAAETLEKYGSILELLGGFKELNPGMTTINQYQFLLKMGIPYDIASLVMSGESINTMSTSEDLGKFLINKKLKNGQAALPAPEEDVNFGESVKYSVNSKTFLKANYSLKKQLNEVYKTIKGVDRDLKENVLKSKNSGRTEIKE